jgi:hypothetical protein
MAERRANVVGSFKLSRQRRFALDRHLPAFSCIVTLVLKRERRSPVRQNNKGCYESPVGLINQE